MKCTEHTPPDLIAQVGEMLKRISEGNWAAPKLKDCVEDGDDPTQAIQTDNAIVVASAQLAVAAELREINNNLDAILDTLRDLAAAMRIGPVPAAAT